MSEGKFVLKQSGIVNVDRQAHDVYWLQRKNASNANDKATNSEQINNMVEQINQLKQDQSEIKDLLLKLLEKNK